MFATHFRSIECPAGKAVICSRERCRRVSFRLSRVGCVCPKARAFPPILAHRIRSQSQPIADLLAMNNSLLAMNNSPRPALFSDCHVIGSLHRFGLSLDRSAPFRREPYAFMTAGRIPLEPPPTGALLLSSISASPSPFKSSALRSFTRARTKARSTNHTHR